MLIFDALNVQTSLLASNKIINVESQILKLQFIILPTANIHERKKNINEVTQ